MRNTMRMRGVLALALMAAQSPFSDKELVENQNHIRSLHANYNSRNLQGTMSRHKAKMKCKKYCRAKK